MNIVAGLYSPTLKILTVVSTKSTLNDLMISDGAGDNSYPKDRYPGNDVLHMMAETFSIAYPHHQL